MFIKKESIDGVFARTQDNFKKLDIKIKPEAMARFEGTLSEIAANGAYEEGAKIKESDLMRIINEAGLVFNDIASGDEKIQNPVESLMTVNDYLYAMAMQKLGSPDIPALFGDEMQRSVCKLAARISGKQSVDRGIFFADNVYEAQRGMDAEEIKENESVKRAIDAAAVGAATPDQVQRLAAEYQALAKRQSNHGAIWRLFHSKENAARTELLSQMEGALKTMLGDDASIKNSTPLLLAEGLIENTVASETRIAFGREAMERRGGISAKDFNVKQIDSKMFLKTGYRPDLENIEQEWSAIKPLYDSVQRGELFGERNVASLTAKEILSKNYIRIQLFKAKVEKDGMKSAGGLLEEMESHYAYEDAQFDKANPEYVVPDPSESAEKERIAVNLDEPAAEKSERVEENVKSAIEKNIG